MVSLLSSQLLWLSAYSSTLVVGTKLVSGWRSSYTTSMEVPNSSSNSTLKILSDHEITSSYGEVLQFRKSVAKFVFENQSDYHKTLGLSVEIGPIFSWADNYDLHIVSPNGLKSTHAMVMGFTQHPAAITEAGNIGAMQFNTPRLENSLSSLQKQGFRDGALYRAPQGEPSSTFCRRSLLKKFSS